MKEFLDKITEVLGGLATEDDFTDEFEEFNTPHLNHTKMMRQNLLLQWTVMIIKVLIDM